MSSGRSLLRGVLPSSRPRTHSARSDPTRWRLRGRTDSTSPGASPDTESPATSDTATPPSTSSFLRAQAALEEAEEERTTRKSGIVDPEARPWDGDEPQDQLIRRILNDTYKPLRIKGFKKAVPTPAPLPSHLFDTKPTPDAATEPPKYPWEVKYVRPNQDSTPLVRAGGVMLNRPDRVIDKLKRMENALDSSFDYRSGFNTDGRPRVLVPQEDGVGTRTTAKTSKIPVGMRAWNGFVEDKIEQARSEGQFRKLAGRGKPLANDEARSNPYIKRSDFLINRIIHTQGASPPWIEIQIELEHSLTSFRSELRSSWVRRSVRMLSLDGASRTAIFEVKNGWRDPEWEAKERKYHETAVASVNSLLRRYNALAPYSVRKPLLALQRELDACFKDSIPVIEAELLRILEGGGSRPAAKAGAQGSRSGPDAGEEQAEVKESMWKAFRRLVRQVAGKDG